MTNPFLKYREQVARAMCVLAKGNPDESFYGNKVWTLYADGANAALDALWSAMQAEGSVWEHGAAFDHKGKLTFLNPKYAAFPIIIIRTEPTDV